MHQMPGSLRSAKLKLYFNLGVTTGHLLPSHTGLVEGVSAPHCLASKSVITLWPCSSDFTSLCLLWQTGENNSTYLARLLEELSKIYAKCSNKQTNKKTPDTQEAPVIIMMVNLLDVRQALHRAQHLAKILTVIIAGFKFRKERGDLARTGQLKELFGSAGGGGFQHPLEKVFGQERAPASQPHKKNVKMSGRKEARPPTRWNPQPIL